jgi:hypothetical protein
MKQLVITPDCPRCHGPLWATPCTHLDGCSGEHYECTDCRVEWVYRAQDREWIRFGELGQVVEILPPRRPRFKTT